jgi:tRNA/tmRNA/rRNA uracil-C5-methylase (TrmA/RlmC/RlmD family)
LGGVTAPEVLDFHEIPFKISSFALQFWDGGNNSAPETCEAVDLRGSSCIYDSLGGIRFRISHSAFFQVNTVAFELLLQRLQVKSRSHFHFFP